MTQKKPKLAKRIRYYFDKLFSIGPAALVAGLGLLSAVIILISASLVFFARYAPTGEQPYSFLEAAWWSLVQTMGEGGIDVRGAGWGFRLWMFLVTLGSIFIVSNFIGIVANAIQEKMADLRRGRSEVIENNHTIILGWSEHIFTIISEIVLANQNTNRSAIVILGPQEKPFMEDQIRQRVGSDAKTRIICRTGDPIEMADLTLTNFNLARSIIVLSPDSPNPDADVIKVVLAITNHPARRSEPYHITAILRDPNNADIARVVGKDEVEWVLASDVIARIIAQTSQQPGLSLVYSELLDFGNNEIYFHKEALLSERTFKESLKAFDQDMVIGLQQSGQAPRLNPPMDTVLQPSDQLILIASDNGQIHANGDAPVPIQTEAIQVDNSNAQARSENTLILGWNWRAVSILKELDHYALPKSKVRVIANQKGLKQAIKKQDLKFENIQLSFQKGNITSRALLDSINFNQFNHVILLSYSDQFSVQQADSNTLITLLHLRDIARRNLLDFSIVTEMLDLRNRDLAEVTRADDFIVSDRLISLMTAQISENKNLNAIFADLFDPHGSEIYLKPAGRYIRPGTPVSFHTVVEAARRNDELAIGYRMMAASRDRSKRYGVVINPNKNEQIVLDEDDFIVVIANTR